MHLVALRPEAESGKVASKTCSRPVLGALLPSAGHAQFSLCEALGQSKLLSFPRKLSSSWWSLCGENLRLWSLFSYLLCRKKIYGIFSWFCGLQCVLLGEACSLRIFYHVSVVAGMRGR